MCAYVNGHLHLPLFISIFFEVPEALCELFGQAPLMPQQLQPVSAQHQCSPAKLPQLPPPLLPRHPAGEDGDTDHTVVSSQSSHAPPLLSPNLYFVEPFLSPLSSLFSSLLLYPSFQVSLQFTECTCYVYASLYHLLLPHLTPHNWPHTTHSLLPHFLTPHPHLLTLSPLSHLLAPHFSPLTAHAVPSVCAQEGGFAPVLSGHGPDSIVRGIVPSYQ